MPSPVSASGDVNLAGFPAIMPTTRMQDIQAGSKIASVKLAENIATQAAPPPTDGRGRIVDTFA